jgi:signal transduction histidine kinase
VVLRITPDGDTHLEIEVEDTGIGIAPENLDRLFVALEQLDDSTTKSYPGTGLGLALVKRFAAALGGTVGVRSEPGKGSTFTARLPRR